MAKRKLNRQQRWRIEKIQEERRQRAQRKVERNHPVASALGDEQTGVVVANVNEDSPAQKAGLQRNDTIIAINGRDVKSVQDLRLVVSQIRPGTEVSLKVLREGKERVFKAELGTLTDAAAGGQLFEGVELSPVTDELRRQFGVPENVNGLVITSIDPDSEYTRRLVVGAVIVEINREAVTDLKSASALMTDGRNLLLLYYRGAFRYLAINPR